MIKISIAFGSECTSIIESFFSEVKIAKSHGSKNPVAEALEVMKKEGDETKWVVNRILDALSSIYSHEFKTEEEANAYLQGVEDACGWHENSGALSEEQIADVEAAQKILV